MAMTTYLENKVARHTAGIEVFTMPTTLYLCLLTSDPTNTGNFTSEVVAVDYSRLSITGSLQVANNVITNSVVLNFPAALNNWGLVSHVIIADAATGGNALYYGQLQTPKQMDIGEVFAALAQNMSITIN